MSTNLINGKSYIGWCVDFNERKNRHLNNAKKGKDTHFYNAIRKYGEENFIWEILLENLKDFDECKKKEIELIEKYDTYYNGYNSTKGGDGGDTFSKLTDEQKKIFRMKCSKNNSRYWKGKKFSKEVINKLKNADRSKQFKPVRQKTLKGEFIKEWKSMSEASKELKLYHISSVCRGERKTCGGYIWEYI